MQLKLFINSARDLKHVNWRSGRSLQPYAVIWIDSGGKRSTKIDSNNGTNPVWNETFKIPLPSKSRPETAVLHIDIVHVAADAKQLVGSVNLPVRIVLDELALPKPKGSNNMASFSLILERPSGRSQGSLEIRIEAIINGEEKGTGRNEPFRQHVRNTPPVPPPVQPVQIPQQMNRCHNNMPAPVIRPILPQNFWPILPQQPGNFMFVPNIITPQLYRPVLQQQPQPLAALNRIMLHAGKNHLESMMMQSAQQIAQPGGGLQGDTGIDGSGIDNGGFGDGVTGFDGGFDFGGFGNGGFDLGGFGGSGCDLGGFGGGVDFGGFGF